MVGLMYTCNDCNKEFKNPHMEWLETDDNETGEYTEMCPNCFSININKKS